MQSCPKNVVTGPIIGSSASKGPVLNNHMSEAKFDTSLTTVPSDVNKNSCKIENIMANNLMNKTINYEMHSNTDENHLTRSAMEPPRNISVDCRLVSSNPFPVQSVAIQSNEINNNTDSNITKCSEVLQRRARVGKSMERERQMMIMNCYQNIQSGNNIVNNTNDLKGLYSNTDKVLKQEFENRVKVEKPYILNSSHNNINNQIEIETIKTEPEGVSDYASIDSHDKDVTTCNEKENSKSPSSTNTNCIDSTKSKCNISEEMKETRPTIRKKLLDKPNTIPKRSPQSSYKSLIRRTNPPKYLSSSKSKLVGKKSTFKTSNRRRPIIRPSRKILRTRKRKYIRIKSSSKCNENSQKLVSEAGMEKEAATKCQENVVKNLEKEESISKSLSTQKIAPISNLDLVIDRVAKGYFSESEILSKVSNPRIKKVRKEDKRSKSEANRSINGKFENLTETKNTSSQKSAAICESSEKIDTNSKTNKCKNKNQIKITKTKMAKNDNDNTITDKISNHSEAPEKNSKKMNEIEKICKEVESSNPKKRKLAKTNNSKKIAKTEVKSSSDTKTITKEFEDTKINDADVANNNKECFANYNKCGEFQESISEAVKKKEAVKLTPKVPRTEIDPTLHNGSKSSKRNKRQRTWSRKRQKLLSINEINEQFIPKKPNSTPRWSNGWSWEGEPYQAYVFLNVSL
jgi:hypothetical protein